MFQPFQVLNVLTHELTVWCSRMMMRAACSLQHQHAVCRRAGTGELFVFLQGGADVVRCSTAWYRLGRCLVFCGAMCAGGIRCVHVTVTAADARYYAFECASIAAMQIRLTAL
jgi:hypothetical protein